MKTRRTETHLTPAALVSHTMIRIQGEQEGEALEARRLAERIDVLQQHDAILVAAGLYPETVSFGDGVHLLLNAGFRADIRDEGPNGEDLGAGD